MRTNCTALCLAALLIVFTGPATAQDPAPLADPTKADLKVEVADVPTREGVFERLLIVAPSAPKAIAVLLSGGNGGLALTPEGAFGRGGANFLVRSRSRFARAGLLTVVVDAPSDRQGGAYFDGFRRSPEHAADLKAVFAWLRARYPLPVWLMGTSRGTLSAAYVAVELTPGGGPDGLVLTSSLLSDRREGAVTDLDLSSLRIPVLVVHHRDDGCFACSYTDVPRLMSALRNVPRAELMTMEGGETRGNPCESWAFHGYNGIEDTVVRQIARWVLAP